MIDTLFLDVCTVVDAIPKGTLESIKLIDNKVHNVYCPFNVAY